MVEGSANGSSLPQMDNVLGLGQGFNPLSELMRAIILRVIDDYRHPGELREEAEHYLFSEEEEYVFSFISICRYLGLDPEKTREGIIHAKHKISTRRRAA